VEKRNEQYQKLCEAHTESDRFASHATQTLNYPLKNQNEMAAANAGRDMVIQATSYDIFDTMVAVTSERDDDAEQHNTSADMDAKRRRGKGETALEKFVRETVEMSIASPMCMLDVEEVSLPAPPEAAGEKRGKDKSSGYNASSSANKSRSRVVATASMISSDPTRSANTVIHASGSESEKRPSQDRGAPVQGVMNEASTALEVDGSHILFENEVRSFAAS
jgi:hypothetical protein